MYLLRNALAAILLYHAGILVIVAATGRWSLVKELIAGWHALAALGLSLFGLLGGATIYVLSPLMGLDYARMTAVLAELGLVDVTWFAFIGYYCLVNPWLEELFWRGFLVRRERRPVPVDLLFAGYHALVVIWFVDWPWVMIAFFSLTTAAWLWRRTAHSTGGLLLPVISHFAADVGIIIAAQLLLF